MKFLFQICILILLVILISCEKEIPWETEEIPVMLVVEGSFTNQFTKHQVKLSLSADYFYNRPTPKVSGADVTISDGTNTFELIEHPVGSGIYETLDSVAGEPGKTYSLDINLNEPVNNTKHYYASGDLIQGIDIDSLEAYIYENPVYSIDDNTDSLILVAVSFGQDPANTQNYYQLNLYKNHLLINDTIDEAQLIDDKEGINGEAVNAFLFFEEFEEGDSVQLEIISVEKMYFEFVNTIQQLANQSFDPFNMSGPPANAIGNIEGADAIGFFKVGYVSRGATITRYFNDEE